MFDFGGGATAMRVAALILGILGGLFGLSISFYGQLALSMFSEGIQKAFGMLIIYAIPIASLVGGGMAITNAQAAVILMLISAAGWFAVGAFFGYGFNFITMSPMILSGIGGLLALAAANTNGAQKSVVQVTRQTEPLIRPDPGPSATQRHDKTPIDYYPVISRAIANLDPNTEQTRKTLYDRARQAVIKELRSRNPEMGQAKLQAELSSLEAAIRRIERELRTSASSNPQAHVLYSTVTTTSRRFAEWLNKRQRFALGATTVVALALIGLGAVSLSGGALLSWGQSRPYKEQLNATTAVSEFQKCHLSAARELHRGEGICGFFLSSDGLTISFGDKVLLRGETLSDGTSTPDPYRGLYAYPSPNQGSALVVAERASVDYYVFNPETQNVTLIFRGDKFRSEQFMWSPSGKYMATQLYGYWFVYEARTGKRVKADIASQEQYDAGHDLVVDYSSVRWVSDPTISFRGRWCKDVRSLDYCVQKEHFGQEQCTWEYCRHEAHIGQAFCTKEQFECRNVAQNKSGLIEFQESLNVPFVPPGKERLYSFDLLGVSLGMEAQAGVNAVIANIKAQEPNATDWIDASRQCSEAARRKMASDGVARSPNLKSFCFGTVYVGFRGSWSTALAAVSFVEHPTQNIPVVSSIWYAVRVPQGSSLDADAFLTQLTKKYGPYDASEIQVANYVTGAKDNRQGRYVWGDRSFNSTFLMFNFGNFGERGMAGQPVVPGLVGNSGMLVNMSDAYLPGGSYLFLADIELVNAAGASYQNKTTQYVAPALR
jgi:hypothetical protein